MAIDSGTWLIALTETHLTDEVLDGEILMQGFELFRVDRIKGTKGGGVAAYLREDLVRQSGLVQGESLGCVEYLLLYLSELRTVVALLYRPEGHREQFQRALEKIGTYIEGFGEPTPSVIMIGDFNFPIINWKTLEITGGSTAEENLQALSLMEFTATHCLEQYMNKPTRGNNILDLIFTNNEELIYGTHVEDSNLSDHRLIYVETAFERDKESSTRSESTGLGVLNFFDSKVKWEQLENELSLTDWNAQLRGKTADDTYEEFVKVLQVTCPRHIPKKRCRKRKSIPRDRKLLMRRKRRIKSRLQKTHCPRLREKLTKVLAKIDLQLTESVKVELEREEERAVGVILTNPKYFYTYAQSKSKVRAGIGPLESGGRLVGEPAEMVELLQDQYSSAFSTPKFNSLSDIRRQGVEGEGELFNIEFTREDVERVMGELSSTASPGPDKIPAILLSKCKRSLSGGIHCLWNESLRVGRIPAKLKEATITPIYKGEGKGMAKNYRPVCLTSHVIKVFERIVAGALVDYLEKGNKMNPNQHGFRKQRSCLTQLVQHHYHILRVMEEGMDADVVYLDFAKAFDKVDHGVLLSKLKKLGVVGSVFRWLFEFLVGRTQTVTTSGAESRTAAVVSGVPQGTVFGYILFLVHVLDIDNTVKYSRVSSFADDSRIGKPIIGEED